MNVAVLCFTRDRIGYTKHCLPTLARNAGCDYDLMVLDNASSDGTPEWLQTEFEADRVHTLCLSDENIGICRAANTLLDNLDLDDYDAIVRYDNDCEVTMPDTLAICASLAAEYGVIAAPNVLGLRQPPPTFQPLRAGTHIIDQTRVLGGIFMAIPATVFHDGYRFDETQPPYTGDEAVVGWHRQRGGLAGYVRGLSVNHYLTSDGQDTDTPEYTARKLAEMRAA